MVEGNSETENHILLVHIYRFSLRRQELYASLSQNEYVRSQNAT